MNPTGTERARREAGGPPAVGVGGGVRGAGRALAACSSTNSTSTDSTGLVRPRRPSRRRRSATTPASPPRRSRWATSPPLLARIFKGAAVGTEAYADYVNSTGGINGRTIIVDSSDDKYAGAPNKQPTQADVDQDFAMVGGFSLFDNFGGTVLQANPQVPNVTVSSHWPRPPCPTRSARPRRPTVDLGPLVYFKKKFPDAIKDAGALVADEPSATVKWTAEKAAMEHEGYNVVYDPTFDITTDRLQPVRDQHEERRGEDPVHGADAGELRRRRWSRPSTSRTSTRSWCSAGRPTARPWCPTPVGPRPSTAPTWNRTPRCSWARTPRPSRRQHLPHLGAEGLTRLPRRPLHAVRLAVGRALRPGAEGGGARSEPGLGAPAAAEDHVVLRGLPGRHGQPGQEDPDQLLHHRQDRERASTSGWTIRR